MQAQMPNPCNGFKNYDLRRRALTVRAVSQASRINPGFFKPDGSANTVAKTHSALVGGRWASRRSPRARVTPQGFIYIVWLRSAFGVTIHATMNCDIYRLKSRTGQYLFVLAGTPPQAVLPNTYPQLGELVLVKTRDIVAGQSLIGASADDIINNITLKGFHIQGVKVVTQVSEGGAAIGGGLLGASVAGAVGAVVGAIIGLAVAEHAKRVPNDL